MSKTKDKRKQLAQFIDDEAELSSEDEGKVSSDENDDSDEDRELEGLVDAEAPELDSDEEEEVRGLYHKQLAQEDHRDLLIMQEHLEENVITYGQTRRKKFRWQEKEMMENSLKRHYDPDDEADDEEDDEESVDYAASRPRIRRPAVIMPSVNEDSNSRVLPTPSTSSGTNTSDIRGFLFKDKRIVEALSTREKVIQTREEKDRVIQRELNRVLHTKSVFDMFS